MKNNWNKLLGPKMRETIGNSPQMFEEKSPASDRAKTLDLLHNLYWECVEMGMPHWSEADEARLFDLSNGDSGTNIYRKNEKYSEKNYYQLKVWIDEKLKTLLDEYQKLTFSASSDVRKIK